MIGWGIFLIICGLAGLEDGSGAIFLIIGIGLLIGGIAKNSSTNSNSTSSGNSNNMYNKITFIINFMEYLYNGCDPKDKQTYSNQLSYWRNLRINAYRLNYNGINHVNETYNLIKKDVDNHRNKILADFDEYYDYNETCPLAVSSNNLDNMRNEIETTTDYKKLDTISGVVRYLMLINSNLEISKIGYSKYNMLPGMPSTPKKIHVEAFQLFITKIYLDDKNSETLFYMYNNLFAESLYSKGVETPVGEVKHFFKKVLKSVEKVFEEKNVEEIIPILMLVDPNFQKNYNPNKKSYEILGLSPNATKEEIEKAYKKLLITSHPDRGGDEEKWAEINEAYTKIKNDDSEKSISTDNSQDSDDLDNDEVFTCDNCGAYVPTDAAKCPKCGLTFEEDDDADEDEEESETEEEKMTCDNCGAYVDDDATECPKCGATFEEDDDADEDEEETEAEKMTCDNCGAYVDDDATECPKCGATFEEDDDDEEEIDENETFECPECGENVTIKNKKCPKCGIKLNW